MESTVTIIPYHFITRYSTNKTGIKLINEKSINQNPKLIFLMYN